jgi:hypothetical protein
LVAGVVGDMDVDQGVSVGVVDAQSLPGDLGDDAAGSGSD